jgi:hypothetical protein
VGTEHSTTEVEAISDAMLLQTELGVDEYMEKLSLNIAAEKNCTVLFQPHCVQLATA